MKRHLAISLVALAAMSQSAYPLFVNAQEQSIEIEAPDDPMQTILTAQKAKKVTILLSSGTEISGTVGEVTFDIVQLKEVTGKEIAGKDAFDATIRTDQVAAVFVSKATAAK